ncbi:MAG: dynamin family protein [Gammaproteobacteria bacterium]|nr:dynamin family protein [Gammaproteobacteria bacterium]
MDQTAEQLAQHLHELQSYLRGEQPRLAELVDEYQQLDQVAYRMGLLSRSQSYADRVSWWPLIAVLGTFSAGKSTFINDYLEFSLQRTGHQAVDDKFSVICYAGDGHSKTLPGTALDADPRFPFYSVGKEIEGVAKGEGRKLDSYLQIKTCPCEKLKGKILVDSPGFDADEQRTATLRIADRIIDRADLVMVFFDAHRPEPGAIRDTLEHLVEKAIARHDATKFIYILNQIDVTADENNLEDVVAAWQRALAQKGLTAGRFYRVFSQTACTHIENEEAARRLIDWREQDMADLDERLELVEVQRIYRVADSLRHQCHHIEESVVPELKERISDWRRFVLFADAAVLITMGVAALFMLLFTGEWSGLQYTPAALVQTIFDSMILKGLLAALVVGTLAIFHFGFRRFAQQRFRPTSDEHKLEGFDVDALDKAFVKSTGPFRSLFMRSPSGWHYLNRRRLSSIYFRAGTFIKQLNDSHIQPDGSWQDEVTSSTATADVEEIIDQEKVTEEEREKEKPLDI